MTQLFMKCIELHRFRLHREHSCRVEFLLGFPGMHLGHSVSGEMLECRSTGGSRPIVGLPECVVRFDGGEYALNNGGMGCSSSLHLQPSTGGIRI